MTKELCLIDAASLSETLCEAPIEVELKYATTDNFIGKPIVGYDPAYAHVCPMTPKAATALCDAQQYFNARGLGLFVFDAYRPLRTVQYWTQWFSAPATDPREQKRKKIHYPRLEKSDLPKLGFVAGNVSRHCFGHTIDLTLMDLSTKELLDMGAIFDFFDPIAYSNVSASVIGEEAYENRQCLAAGMIQAGFKPYEKEFWHFEHLEQEALEPFDLPIDGHLFERKIT